MFLIHRNVVDRTDLKIHERNTSDSIYYRTLLQYNLISRTLRHTLGGGGRSTNVITRLAQINIANV